MARFLVLVTVLLLAGCLESPRPPASNASLPTIASPPSLLPTLTPSSPAPPSPTPAPTNASESRPSLCGGGTHGSAKPSCLVLAFHDLPRGLRWEDVGATLSSGEAVAYDRGAETNGTVNPSPPSRAAATSAAWCAPDRYEDEAWCSYGGDPSGPVTEGAMVLVWWTSDAAVAGQRVTFFDAAHEPFASSSPLA